MTWFKVDDNYWSHPKVLLTPLDMRGMWVTAGSWCAQHLTDGCIPNEILERIVPARPARASAIAADLERLGLWMRHGDDWIFHDWGDYQPSRLDVESERQASRQRQQAWRQRQKTRPITTPKDQT